jgi:hypothetical protein
MKMRLLLLFAAQRVWQAAPYKRGSAFDDLNNDGFMDTVVTALNNKPRILLNSADNGNHSLMIDTVGRRGNRDGIGAQI